MTKPKWYHYLLAASSQDTDNPTARMHSPLEEAKAYASGDKSKITDIQKDQIEYDKKSGIAKGATALVMLSPLKTLPWKIMTHPVVEATGTLTGLYNLATDQGVEKTINHVKNNEYGKATLSALGDIMDVSPITGAVKGTVLGANAIRQGANLTDAVKTIKDNFPILKFQRIFSRPNRAKHAYATINPFGYDNPIKRGIKWMSSVLADRKINIDDIHPDASKYISSPGAWGVWNKNREDAWRIYNGLPQKHNTYILNKDGSYSYNLPVVMERRPDKYINFESDTHTLGYDVIGMNHGGLTGHEIVDMPDGKRVHFIEDIWDLHPFSRNTDTFSNRYLAPGIKAINRGIVNVYDKLYDAADWLLDKRKISQAQHDRLALGLRKHIFNNQLSIPKFKWEEKLANLEAGKILGGTPFVMKTRVPTKLELTEGQFTGDPIAKEVYDDMVDYFMLKEPLQLKFNFDNINKNLNTE